MAERTAGHGSVRRREKREQEKKTEDTRYRKTCGSSSQSSHTSLLPCPLLVVSWPPPCLSRCQAPLEGLVEDVILVGHKRKELAVLVTLKVRLRVRKEAAAVLQRETPDRSTDWDENRRHYRARRRRVCARRDVHPMRRLKRARLTSFIDVCRFHCCHLRHEMGRD